MKHYTGISSRSRTKDGLERDSTGVESQTMSCTCAKAIQEDGGQNKVIARDSF